MPLQGLNKFQQFLAQKPMLPRQRTGAADFLSTLTQAASKGIDTAQQFEMRKQQIEQAKTAQINEALVRGFKADEAPQARMNLMQKLMQQPGADKKFIQGYESGLSSEIEKISSDIDEIEKDGVIKAGEEDKLKNLQKQLKSR